jgi:hypothetical protein
MHELATRRTHTGLLFTPVPCPIFSPIFCSSPNNSIYDYQVKIGDILGTKYRVLESLGKVSSSTVYGLIHTSCTGIALSPERRLCVGAFSSWLAY